MKKGQIRTGIVEEVRFPNRAMVHLEPLEGEETVLETAEYCEVKGEEVRFPNRAMVHLEPLEGEETVLETAEYCEVKGALPGQRVSFAVTKVRKGKGEGRLKEILSKAPEETMDEENGGCRYFGSCGGCSYMSMPYEERYWRRRNTAKSRALCRGRGFLLR